MPSSAPRPSHSAARRPVLFALLGILLVFGVRLSFIRQANFCGVPDSCSYLTLAQTLSTRHVFQANYADDLQLDHVTLPATGIEYWRPGTSFFLLLARPLGSITLHSSLVVTLLAGLLMAMAAWRIAMQFDRDPGLAALSVLLAFILPAVWDSSLIADSGLFYGAAVAWFLALFTVRFQGYLADALALVCVAVAYLVRNDAAILIVPLLVVLLLRHRAAHSRLPASGNSDSIHLESPRTELEPAKSCSPLYCALILVGFFLALVPMHLIDLLVLGKAFPGAASRVLYFNDLSDLGSYGSLVNLHSWLSVGLGRLIKLRVATMPLILYRIFFIVMGAGLIFIPLLFVRRREDGSRVRIPEIAGGLTFFATLLSTESFSLLSESFPPCAPPSALLPLAAVLILVAIRNFLPLQAARVLSTAIIVYYLIFGVMYARRTLAEQAKDGDQVRLYGTFLHANGVDPATTRLITDDPDQMYATNGYPSIQLPVNGAPAIAQLASDLHATHVLLDPAAHDLPMAELRSNLHPVAITPMPNSTFVLLTLPAPVP